MTATLTEARTDTTASSTVRLTMAQALVRFMMAQEAEQVDGSTAPVFAGIWGIFGHGNVAGLGEALHQYRDHMAHFRGQNEQSMAHAAIAFAKEHRRRRVMGVTTSIGPGATNLVTAAALAHCNRLPVLLLPGDTFANRKPDPVLQQLEDPCCPLNSVNDCLRPVSRFFDRITRPEQLIASLPQAMQTLLDPVNCGPVTLCLPQDVQAEAYEFPIWLFETTVHRLRRTPPEHHELQAAAELLRKAKNPLIVAGGGVHYSGACDALDGFSRAHQIPVTETQAGKGSLSWNHPWNVGAIGVTGNPCANMLANECDVALFVGTRLSDFTTASKTLFKNPNFRAIGLNVGGFDAIKLGAQTLVCDAKAGLEALNLELGHHKSSDCYHNHVSEERTRWLTNREAWCEGRNSPPSDAEVIGVVNATVGNRATVVCAAGGLPGELHKLWHTPHQHGYHLEYAYSCMGYEIAAGLGVKMAHPESEVYVMVGDGSYLMMHSELLTAMQMGLKVNVVLLDNGGFGCINRLQQGCGSAPYGNLFGETARMDFAANAASYGCKAVKVDSLEALRKQLEANKTETRCCVTVLETDPQASSPGTAWWDVPISEVSENPSVRSAHEDYRGQH